ncbi:MAG: hypothetical protein EBU90_19290 [Proteobacteria bacterium]|nr:hypothetical protein [Pseudomonadota bacterium]
MCCLKLFHSVVYNTKTNACYDKCEECRNLQSTLKTNTLIHGLFVYGINKERYYIDSGKAIRVCSAFTCDKILPCDKHNQETLVQCSSTKCLNCFELDKTKYCQRCQDTNSKSKDNLRLSVRELKQKLGNKCIDCGDNNPFFLEFDHKDPAKKNVQITRSRPHEWEQEIPNIELRCGRCHRYKTELHQKRTLEGKHMKCRDDKKDFVRKIKESIGKCQVCLWTSDNTSNLCVALDFDHITGDKKNQISNMYFEKRETIAKEIAKTRLICRHCHELYTCLQRGGKALRFYYTPEQIEVFKKQLYDDESKRICQQELVYVLNNLGYNVEID